MDVFESADLGLEVESLTGPATAWARGRLVPHLREMKELLVDHVVTVRREAAARTSEVGVDPGWNPAAGTAPAK